MTLATTTSSSILLLCPWLLILLLQQLTIIGNTSAFIVLENRKDCYYGSSPLKLELQQSNDNNNDNYNNDDKKEEEEGTEESSSLFWKSRRRLIVDGPTVAAAAASGVVAASSSTSPEKCLAAGEYNPSDVYKPAVRPTAYLVDSTIPPTLIPLKNSRQEKNALAKLGRGSGTDKDAVVIDRLNLNNMLNKAVFGTADKISSLVNPDESKSGPGYASFVALGLPARTKPVDIELAESLVATMASERRGKDTALGLSFCPLSAQPALDEYIRGGGGEPQLIEKLAKTGIPKATIGLYMPLLRFAKRQQNSWSLLAMSPEFVDIETSRTGGLQEVDSDRRARYVVDADGFIELSSQPKFQVYTDRSLLKDYAPKSANDTIGDFFAERILVHETGATVVSQYAASAEPESLVVFTAPIPDVRFMEGINGRIPRICKKLFAAGAAPSKITDDQVTTILLNPTAKETLSLTRYLRLEIGTGPDTLPYLTKISDYLWFSSSPKVNMIPRMME